MFGNGNNQAMQFMMQGYSDSIKTYDDQSAGNLMKNINGLTNSYFQNESSIQNTEAQRLSNHFNRENMQTALDKEKALLKHQQLSNQYDEDSMAFRLSKADAEARAEQANALYKEGTLDDSIKAANTQSNIRVKTGNSEIDKTNAQNYEATKQANLESEIIDNQHANFKGRRIYYDNNGFAYENVVTDKEGKVIGFDKRMSPERQAEIEAFNARILQNKQKVSDEFMARNNASLEQNINNEIQARNLAQLQNNQYQANQELNDILKQAGMSPFQLAQAVNQANQVGSKEVNIGGVPFDTMTLNAVLNGYPVGNSNFNSNTNVAMNNTYFPDAIDIKTEKERNAFSNVSLTQLANNKNFTSQDRYNYFLSDEGALAVERNAVAKQKIITELDQKIMQNANNINDLENVKKDTNRLSVLVGSITKYLPFEIGDAAMNNAIANIASSQNLLNGASNIKGPASDKDMEIIRDGAYQMYSNDQYNNQVLFTMYRTQYNNYRLLIKQLAGDPRNEEVLITKYGLQTYQDYLKAKAVYEEGRKRGINDKQQDIE